MRLRKLFVVESYHHVVIQFALERRHPLPLTTDDIIENVMVESPIEYLRSANWVWYTNWLFYS